MIADNELRLAPTSSADRPLLTRRRCANLNQGLLRQPDDNPGHSSVIEIIPNNHGKTVDTAYRSKPKFVGLTI